MTLSKYKKIAIAAAHFLISTPIKKKKRRKRCWVQPWLGDHNRRNYSFIYSLEPSLLRSDLGFRDYIRMNKSVYEELLGSISSDLAKQDTNMRQAISPAEKLSVTLSYLAEGLSYRRLSYEYRIGTSTVGVIVTQTLQAIVKHLGRKYLKTSTSSNEWRTIAQEFEQRWNYPNCIGALDGKHIMLHPPSNSGSEYRNYKEGFSIVLMALVDADYRFTYIELGHPGRMSDGAIWNQSKLKAAISDGTINFPEPETLPGSNRKLPHVIVADAAFGLQTYCMRPYPGRELAPGQKIYNYRHSRARRISENAFGILANRWRILLGRMKVDGDKAMLIVHACCILHNFLRSHTSTRDVYTPLNCLDSENFETGEIINGTWRDDNTLGSVQLQHGRISQNAKDVRDEFKEFFLYEGSVSWQERFALRSNALE